MAMDRSVSFCEPLLQAFTISWSVMVGPSLEELGMAIGSSGTIGVGIGIAVIVS